MRQWLVMMVTNWLQRLLGSTQQPASPDEVEAESEEAMPPCPICGEEWEEGEIFCYHCGYQLFDQKLPLHPPPERTGALTDPDGKLDEATRARLSERFSRIGEDSGLDFAVLVLPGELSARLGKGAEDGRGEYLDGMAYCLYNTWLVGKDTGLKGLLLVVDPKSEDRALVMGRNGPQVEGLEFRDWYEKFSPGSIAEELEHIADRM